MKYFNFPSHFGIMTQFLSPPSLLNVKVYLAAVKIAIYHFSRYHKHVKQPTYGSTDEFVQNSNQQPY